METAMSLFERISDTVKGALGPAGEAAAPALLASVLAKAKIGGLQGIVEQLQQGGLGEQVKSWLGDGRNLPVDPAQLQAALGSDQVRQLAAQFGLPVDEALKFLSQHLPAAVDQASPNGTLQS